MQYINLKKEPKAVEQRPFPCGYMRALQSWPAGAGGHFLSISVWIYDFWAVLCPHTHPNTIIPWEAFGFHGLNAGPVADGPTAQTTASLHFVSYHPDLQRAEEQPRVRFPRPFQARKREVCRTTFRSSAWPCIGQNCSNLVRNTPTQTAA